ncbi:hypothetical protein BT69DRAFT_1216054 [Atractiella rhizophila]|nr:hypothetical protein BT69DRAFT_1216054 [Atractiella rhizophila]
MADTRVLSASTCESPSDVVYRVANEWMLNEQQLFSFKIIVQRFFNLLYDERNEEPLCMFVTGPGGTGKTQVINTVCDILKQCAQSHQIRVMAPTGNAAALVDGTTIHSGLQIPVREESKANEAMDTDMKEFIALLTVKQKDEL